MTKYRLKDVADVFLSNVDKKSYPNQKNVILCNFVDVYKNWEITKTLSEKFMKATASDSEIVKFSLRKGTVAITKDSETKDDIGISTFIADDIDNLVLGYHCALIVPHENCLLGEYLNIILHSPFAQKYFENNASGSGQRYTLTAEIIGNMPVYLPSLIEQASLSKLPQLIESKINANNLVVNTIESMAKDIYNYWFVQFDFPDENGKPYKSSGGKMVWNEQLKREIPAGWNIASLKDKVCIARGISYSSEDIESGKGIPMINLGSIDTSRNYKPEELKYYNGKVLPEMLVRDGAMLIACTDLTRNREIIGSPILVPADETAYVYSMDIACLRSIDASICDLYLYMSLRTDFYHDFIKNWASGTNVLHLDLNGLFWYPLLIPPVKLQQNYSEIVKAVHKQKSLLLVENKDLKELRDWLLPMLMNGQVKVG